MALAKAIGVSEAGAPINWDCAFPPFLFLAPKQVQSVTFLLSSLVNFAGTFSAIFVCRLLVQPAGLVDSHAVHFGSDCYADGQMLHNQLLLCMQS